MNRNDTTTRRKKTKGTQFGIFPLQLDDARRLVAYLGRLLFGRLIR